MAIVAVWLALGVLLLVREVPMGELELSAESPVTELEGDLAVRLLPCWCLGSGDRSSDSGSPF